MVRRPDGTFPKGTSGNPGGRPRGLRTLEDALGGARDAANVLPVIDKLRELALSGDVAAARVYLDRMLGPVRRSQEAEPNDDLSGAEIDDLVAKLMEDPEIRGAVLRHAQNGERATTQAGS